MAERLRKLTKPPSLPFYQTKKVGSLYSEIDLNRAIGAYVSEVIGVLGFPADYILSKLRVFAYSVAIVCGALAFALKFPDHIILIWITILIFGAMMGSLTLLDLYVSRNAQIALKGPGGERLTFDCKLDRQNYEMLMAFRPLPSLLPAWRPEEYIVTRKIYVGKLFTADGYLVAENVYEELRQLLIRLLEADNKKTD